MKKIILILTALLLTTPAMAQTPITKDVANKYYQNCNSQPAQGLSNDSKEYLCACTAANMMEKMSVEDVQAMSAPSPNARIALNKMLVDVYAPCMNYPAKDHYYATCIGNPKTQALAKNPQALCGCMSDQVAKYLGANGQQVFRDILTRNPNITDPMSALTNDPKFQQFAQAKLLSCL